MSTVEIEQVLVVKTELFHSCGYFEGFNSDTDRYLSVLLDPANTQYLPRDEMEENPDFKQLIPYCIFRHRDAENSVYAFQYTRGSGGGEKRLNAKRSVGIGGHVSTLDANEDSPYEVGMQRELDEEVKINTQFHQTLVGLINDDSNSVGQVHLGVVHIFDVDEPKISANEAAISNAGFLPVEDIVTEINEFETWSQICLRSLF
ncbi:MAG: phosphoesterase [Planctomycetota bacterium]